MYTSCIHTYIRMYIGKSKWKFLSFFLLVRWFVHSLVFVRVLTRTEKKNTHQEEREREWERERETESKLIWHLKIVTKLLLSVKNNCIHSFVWLFVFIFHFLSQKFYSIPNCPWGWTFFSSSIIQIRWQTFALNDQFFIIFHWFLPFSQLFRNIRLFKMLL